MIFYAFIKVAWAIVYGLTYVIRFAPDVSLPTALTSTIATASSYATSMNTFLPITELFYTITLIFLIYEAAYFGLKIINWVIRKIPGIS